MHLLKQLFHSALLALFHFEDFTLGKLSFSATLNIVQTFQVPPPPFYQLAHVPQCEKEKFTRSQTLHGPPQDTGVPALLRVRGRQRARQKRTEFI